MERTARSAAQSEHSARFEAQYQRVLAAMDTCASLDANLKLDLVCRQYVCRRRYPLPATRYLHAACPLPVRCLLLAACCLLLAVWV